MEDKEIVTLVTDVSALRRRFTTFKQHAKDRIIDVLLTEQEYRFLMIVKFIPGMTCAYTNNVFIHRKGHIHSPTLDRIDDYGPYSMSNIVLASNSSNVLKDNIDKNITRSGSYDHGIEICIRESLRHKKYKVQQDHLAKLFDEFAHGENAFVSKYFRKPGDSDESVVENVDFQLAKLYCDLLKSYPTSQLSFSEFKRIMSKKRCEITRQEFGGISDKRVLLRNPEYSLSKSNVILVNESTYFFASKLNTISKQYGLTEKQVIQCMNLGGF